MVVGFNEREFDIEVAEARESGEASVAFRDMRLAYLEHDNRSPRALDVINMLRTEPVAGASGPLSDADFMWPVVLILRTALHRGGLSSDHVNLIAREKRKLARLLTTHSPRAVAITTTLYVSHEAIVEVTRFVRRYNRKTRIILGGPYIANSFRRLEPSRRVELYEYLCADYYVTCAEGEATLVSLVGELASGDPHMSTIPDLALRDGDGFVETAARVEDNVVSTPVDYDLFPPEALNAFLSVRTAKSCPFSCSFCAFPQQSGAYTYLDVADVERELDKIVGLGVKTLSFIDDTFNVPKNRSAITARPSAPCETSTSCPTPRSSSASPGRLLPRSPRPRPSSSKRARTRSGRKSGTPTRERPSGTGGMRSGSWAAVSSGATGR